MADVKTHYDQFLGSLYAWMSGDFATQVAKEEAYLSKALKPAKTGAKALDLGAGHGVHSAALAKLGYQVEAVDISAVILEELKKNKGTLAIKPLVKDIRTYRPLQPVDTITCMGDTLAHLASMEEVTAFAGHVHTVLKSGGQLVVSFRDFSTDLKGTGRAVMVRADDTRIFDCFLQFGVAAIDVTDMFHEKTAQGWTLKTSTYKKIRLTAEATVKAFKDNGFSLTSQENTDGIVRLCFRA